MSPAKITHYPLQPSYLGSATSFAVGSHLLVLLVLVLLALLFHVKTLAELMNASAPAPQPPVDQIELILKPDDDQPPPTDHPEWIRQLVKAPEPPPPPKPKPKPPEPTPAPVVQHVAAKPSAAQLTVGSENLAEPTYPNDLYREGVQGTVLISVTFDGSGRACAAEIVSSSGSHELDAYSRRFILENWHQEDLAGQTQIAPIKYQIVSR